MLEKDLAKLFKETFVRYPLLHMVSKSDPGWPDRMIQLPHSRICYAELKIIKTTLRHTFRIELRKEQAAWLAKWQVNGGLCFLLLMDEKSTPGAGKMLVLTQSHWKSWLAVPTTDFEYRTPIKVFDTREKLLEWFESYVNQGSYQAVYSKMFT